MMKREPVILLVFNIMHYCSSAMILKQVVILSRHNVRSPLSRVLPVITPKAWPHFDAKAGELTKKGALLEGYMGEYFAQWLRTEGLLNVSCPNNDMFYPYANNKQRTIASAQAFTDKAFPNCNISIDHARGNDLDFNFNPVVHNASDSFKERLKREMTEKLANVNVGFELGMIEQILDYKNSKDCKEHNNCDLVKGVTEIEELVDGEEPELKGPLHIGNGAMDAFKMEYYSGLPIEDVAWGQITEDSQWRDLMSVNIAYHDIRFNTTDLAVNIATPLIIYMRNLLTNGANKPSVTLLMGHDSNLFTVICSLGFLDYKLKDQYEKVPVGGKLVFQKWFDSGNDRYLLKTEYVYQSSSQIREGQKLSLESPPQIVAMEMKGCPINENGFCLFDDFVKILNKFQL